MADTLESPPTATAPAPTLEAPDAALDKLAAEEQAILDESGGE